MWGIVNLSKNDGVLWEVNKLWSWKQVDRDHPHCCWCMRISVWRLNNFWENVKWQQWQPVLHLFYLMFFLWGQSRLGSLIAFCVLPAGFRRFWFCIQRSINQGTSSCDIHAGLGGKKKIIFWVFFSLFFFPSASVFLPNALLFSE